MHFAFEERGEVKNTSPLSSNAFWPATWGERKRGEAVGAERGRTIGGRLARRRGA
jgi:hypothetical protein